MARTGTDKSNEFASYIWSYIRIDPEYRELYDSIHSILIKRSKNWNSLDHEKYDDARETLRSKWGILSFVDYSKKTARNIRFLPRLSPIFMNNLKSSPDLTRISITVDTRFSKAILRQEFDKVLTAILTARNRISKKSTLTKNRPEHFDYCELYEVMTYKHPEKSYEKIIEILCKDGPSAEERFGMLTKSKLSKIKSSVSDLLQNQEYLPSKAKLRKKSNNATS